jgi:hypothetical protein
MTSFMNKMSQSMERLNDQFNINEHFSLNLIETHSMMFAKTVALKLSIQQKKNTNNRVIQVSFYNNE